MNTIRKVGPQSNIRRFYPIIVLVMLLSNTSCVSTKTFVDYEDVEAVKFWYLPQWVETPVSIGNCEEVVQFTELNRDTVISDPVFIKQYVDIINKLKPSGKELNYDLRVASLVKFKGNPENMRICISLYNGVVIKNDTLMKRNMQMVRLLEEVLYKQLAPEEWFKGF